MSKIVRIGTKVKVKSNLGELRDNCGRVGNLFVNEQMLDKSGIELKVVNSYWDNGRQENRFQLEGYDISDYTWNLEMIEEVSENDMVDTDRICSDCGNEIEEGEELIYLKHYNKWVCKDCLENDYIQCDCGEYYREYDMYSVDNGDFRLCRDCLNDTLDNGEIYRCDDCGGYFSEGNLNISEDRYGYEVHYCDNCYNRHRVENLICGYHNYHRAFELKLASGEIKPPFWVGGELEMENDNIDVDCVEWLKDHFDAILSRDGSLETDGAMEWVDDPRSMKNHYEIANEKRQAFEMLKNAGYRSHNTSTCGLHFHVTRPYQEEIDKLDPYNEDDRKKIDILQEKQDRIIDRIILVMETFKNELIKFSRRDSTYWCKWLSDVVTCDNGKITSLDFIKKNKYESMGHHRALNLENHKTIEFRIFKGTLNFDTYMASLELVNNIATLCSNLDLPLEKISWNKLTKGEYVSKYVKEKGIKCNRYVVDTSATDRVFEHIRERKNMRVVNKLKAQLNKYYEHYTKRFNDIKDSEDWENISMVVSRIRDYTDSMKRVDNSIKDKDYRRALYKISEMRSYGMYFDNEELETINRTMFDLLNIVNI
jgi:hypothetical protein